MEATFPLLELMSYFVLGIAQDALPSGRKIDLIRSQIPVPNPGIGAANSEVKPLLALVQSLPDLHSSNCRGEDLGDRTEKYFLFRFSAMSFLHE
jgi:hypothetical protein